MQNERQATKNWKADCAVAFLKPSKAYIPVDNVKRVEVAQCCSRLCSIEGGFGFWEWPLPLQVVEKLKGKRWIQHISNTPELMLHFYMYSTHNY